MFYQCNVASTNQTRNLVSCSHITRCTIQRRLDILRDDISNMSKQYEENQRLLNHTSKHALCKSLRLELKSRRETIDRVYKVMCDDLDKLVERLDSLECSIEIDDTELPCTPPPAAEAYYEPWVIDD